MLIERTRHDVQDYGELMAVENRVTRDTEAQETRDKLILPTPERGSNTGMGNV